MISIDLYIQTNGATDTVKQSLEFTLCLLNTLVVKSEFTGLSSIL